QALAGEPVVVYRGWERSFCFAADAAAAVVLLVERAARGAWDVGRDDDRRSLLEVARLVCAEVDASESLIDVVEPPPGPAVVLESIDTTPLHGLGWRPHVELEEGVRRTLAALLG
ncbi:MAG TPA: hypothetical protein VNH40_06815, partial [Gaiellaceae bacterium]|nr:hypothetical protein [Gaiellaceae bacterium]